MEIDTADTDARALAEKVRRDLDRRACPGVFMDLAVESIVTHLTGTTMPRVSPPWPKGRDVGRIGDMSPNAHIRVGLDSDNDVYLSAWDTDSGASIEFCCPGGGGGKSSRTRMALIALMVAMEADNAADPGRDWWALRDGRAKAA